MYNIEIIDKLKKLEYCESLDDFAKEVSCIIERLEFDHPETSESNFVCKMT